jgi:hypothetical protein
MGDTRLEEERGEEERGVEERMVEEPGRVKRGQHGPWIPLPRRAAILALLVRRKDLDRNIDFFACYA